MADLLVVAGQLGEVIDEVALGHQHGRFIVEAEGPHIHVGGTKHAQGVALRQVRVRKNELGVQHEGLGELEDPHASLQQCLVVGGLRVVDHELVRLRGHQQLHLNVAVARGGDRLQEGLVRDEVGRAKDELFLGVVYHRIEHAQVGFRGVTGAGGDQLEVVGVGRHGVVIGLHIQGQLLFGFQVPIHREHRGQGRHHRAGHLDHVVDPCAVLGLVFTLDHVHRAQEARVAVNDHDLAVVAQIRAAEAAFVQLQRKHEPPVDVNLGEALAQGEIALVLQTADLV